MGSGRREGGERGWAEFFLIADSDRGPSKTWKNHFLAKVSRFQGVTVPRAVLRLTIFSFTFVIFTLLGNLRGIEKREPSEIWTLSTKILFGGEEPSYSDGFQNCLQFYWVIIKTEF